MSFYVQNRSVENSTNNTLYLLYNFMSVFAGEYKFTANDSDIGDWLVCNGRTLSISDYPDLYSIIGTTFGDDGVGTFNLPDYSGRVLAQPGGSFSYGDSVGEETHTLTVPEIPEHSHTNTHNANGGSQGLSFQNGAATATVYDSSPGENNLITSAALALTINNTGGSGAHNNMQPTLFGGYVLILSKNLVYNDNCANIL